MIENQKQEERIRELKELLKESREQFKSIIERSIDGILIVNERGTVQYINPAGCQILGREREEILGENFGFPLLSHSSTEIEIPKKEKRIVAEMRVVNTCWENEKAYLLSLRDITSKKIEERLRREALERAKKIQGSLFPSSLPQFPTIEIGGRYEQAENIGGDFFDICPVKDGVLLLMADVTGHGLDAALITIFLSTFFRREMELGHENTRPLKLLKRLQRDYFNQGFPDDYSLEVFLAYIKEESLEMSYAAAGNIRAFLLDGEKELKKLPYSHGALINNTITHPLFGSHTIRLSPEQTLLIYTDGVDEPFLFQDPNLGQRYLKKSLHNTLGLLPVKEMAERIIGDMIIRLGNQPKDDMAILAIQPKKMMDEVREWSCSRCTEGLNSLIDGIIKELRELPVDHDLVRMALLEAVSNAMLHTPEKMRVQIRASWNQEELIISVMDRGPGFNWRQTLKERIHLLEAEERGRGLTLIEMAAGHFTLNNQGNKIVMSWPLQKQALKIQ